MLTLILRLCPHFKSVLCCFALVAASALPVYSGWAYEYTTTDLTNKTTAELQLLRNEVYARHGYIFKSKELNEYFSKQTWYKPSHEFSTSKFTIFDREYLQRIDEKENPRPFPYWKIERLLEYRWGPEEYRIGWNNQLLAKDYNNVVLYSFDIENSRVLYRAKQQTGKWIRSATWKKNAARWYAVGAAHFNSDRIVYVNTDDNGVYYDYDENVGPPEKLPLPDSEYAYVNMSVDAYDRPHIALYDAVRGDLVYVTRSGKPWEEKRWSVLVLDSVGDVGLFNSIQADPHGRAHIVYYDASKRQLKYAMAENSDANTVEAITPSIVENPIASAMSLDGILHISFCSSQSRKLWHLKHVSGKWEKSAVTGTLPICGSNSLGLTKNGAPRIAYYDGNDRYLKIVHFKNGNWKSELVEKSSLTISNIKLAIDSNDIPHIAYFSGDINNIKYAVLVSSWAFFDPGIRNFLTNPPVRRDITPPTTKLNIFGSEYLDSKSGVRYISPETYLELFPDDSAIHGGVSGRSEAYYALNSDISNCIERDYFKSNANTKPQNLPVSTGAYCARYEGTFSLPMGKYVLEYLSIDYAGNFGMKQTVTLYVDSVPPQTKVMATGAHYRDGVLNITEKVGIELLAIDAGSGVKSIEFLTDSVPEEGEEMQHEIYKHPLKLTPGMHTLYIMSVDNVGNAEKPQKIQINVN